MGNESSQGSMDQIKELKNYEQVSRSGEGVIYRKRVMGSESQTVEYYMLKEHNYHSLESYEQAYRKYKQSLQLSQQGQSNTLGVKEVVKEQIQHFCSNTYKIFALYEYPQLTLRDEIEVRAKENKYFQECEIVAILQTCVLALEEIRATICFASNLIYISPDGVIKVTHNDLVDENYRHVVTPGIYYAPQKLTNFLTESNSQTALKKEIIFSMGMTLLEACNLQPVHDVYDYSGQKINSQKLPVYIESLGSKYSTELIELLTNMLEPNPNRRISLLQVQRALNKFDEAEGEALNEEEADTNQQLEKDDIEQKCDKFFAKETQHLPGIKESNQSYEEPSIPNLLSNQNSSRISLSKNYQSKGTTNTNEQFYHNIEKSMEGYKITCNLNPNSIINQNNMTAHFAQPVISPPTPQTSSTDHIFTDPKLLQMIRKDLQEINKSRTSRIMMSSKQQVENSWVNNSQSQIENNATNRNKNHFGYENNNNTLSGFEKEPIFDRYAQSNKSFTEYTTLQNCPQVESLAASVVRNNFSSQKNSYVYEQSEVKRQPGNLNQGERQRMKASVALSSKNFGQASQNESTPSTVRYPLRQMNFNNMNEPRNFEQIQFEIKPGMMKKKEANLIYLEQEYEDGVRYQGMSKNGVKEGYGKLLYNDGAYYEGYFHNDKINGKGTLYYKKNCPAYDGQWLDEQFNGYGQLYNEQPQDLQEEFPYNNWNFLENYWVKYQGEFVKDNKHGKGKIILTSDQYIEGLFEDDMLNGQARFYKQNGDCIEGRYQNNILVELKNQN